MFTKSGIMVGLGEKRNEVLQLMDDLRTADVDFLTIGQYLQPTRKHAAVDRFVEPAEFESYKAIALRQGLPGGGGEPADALVLSRGRGFRAAEGGPLGASCQPAECVAYPSPGRFAATLSRKGRG